jgi:hypothetical protein
MQNDVIKLREQLAFYMLVFQGNTKKMPAVVDIMRKHSRRWMLLEKEVQNRSERNMSLCLYTDITIDSPLWLYLYFSWCFNYL